MKKRVLGTRSISASLDDLPSRLPSLQSRSDEVLIATATLGLLATIADGEAHHLEISKFSAQFNNNYALSRRHSLRLIDSALVRIRHSIGMPLIDIQCHTLLEHLDCNHKVQLFEGLAEILIADGKVNESEEYFLEYTAQKLQILNVLEERYRDA